MIQPAMGSGESTANFFIGDYGLQDSIITEEIFESYVFKGKEHKGQHSRRKHSTKRYDTVTMIWVNSNQFSVTGVDVVFMYLCGKLQQIKLKTDKVSPLGTLCIILVMMEFILLVGSQLRSSISHFHALSYVTIVLATCSDASEEDTRGKTH